MIPFPTGPFGAIYADPPWRYKTYSMKARASKGERWGHLQGLPHYDLMELSEICALPVAEIAATDSVLFLWATYPQLPEAVQVMDAWGFTFKTVAFTWVKERGRGWHLGLGFWTRGNPEIVLLGTKGSPKRRDKRVANLVISPLREHSRKPEEVARRIERLVDGPYVELFARRSRPGWSGWGEEYPGDKENPSASYQTGSEGGRILQPALDL